MPTTRQRTVHTLADLVRRLRRSDGFDEVAAALESGRHAAVNGTWGSSCALSVAALVEKAPLVVVLPKLHDVDEFALDVQNFLPDAAPEVFAAWETLPQEYSVADAVFGGRLRVLQALTGKSPPRVVVTSLPALLQPVPSRAQREAGTRVVRVGDEVEPNELMRWLIERGFDRVPAIEAPGEFSLHGGILDLFPPDAVDPYRVEFFGDEVESIRRFDAETQRKLEDLDEVRLTVVTPVAQESGVRGQESEVRGQRSEVRDQRSEVRGQRSALGTEYSVLGTQKADGTRSPQAQESLLDNLPAGSRIALVEVPEMVTEGHAYLDRLDRPGGLLSVEEALARCREFPTVTLSALGDTAEDVACQLHVESIERFSGPRNEVLQELAAAVGRDETVLLACHNEGERRRLEEMLHERDAAAQSATESAAESNGRLGSRVRLCVGRVSHGFRLADERLVVLSDHELFGRTELRRITRRKRPQAESRAIDSFLDLRAGDLVVHLAHGIGRFRGMQVLQKADQAEEHLAIEFADAVRILVPASLIHLVQKYIGAAKTAPPLSKIGGKSWASKKARVAESVRDMAADMLRLQAARASKPGRACPADSEWQREFEDSFPYVETDDQLHAIADVRQDLERVRPMDRLICGDVGFGKTEVAMRAAFKMVDAARQVAVLVPTTVLAEQHYRTFCERMAEFPVTVEVLSRFRTKAEQKRILERMASGAVDIVIGTHRLVQRDVAFKDLGLLVIDEEQRFGVEHKEMLKRMRLEVDVLTLSATPIPRTLHMAVLGIRDISNLTTAPQERVPIETRVTRFDERLIRTAIVRELNRGGQVYFVHNRVYNIHQVADRLRRIVPEANVGVGHGQMAEGELEQVMLDFVDRRLDVLVATTIIESGLDIPNANTIFIHQADKYGLADLHQLRGRVGRYKHRAYCYLLLEEGKPITGIAAKRLKAIEEYSELGAGFRIAMRDLEIRGAGNILGTEQSGHIASVGYELYCQLLENAVRRLKGEPIREHVHVNVNLPVTALLPDDYVPAGRPKIEMYRKLSGVHRLDELAALTDEFRDRFGPLPEVAARLLMVRELQLHAAAWGIVDIHLEERFAVFEYTDAAKIKRLQQRIGSDLRIVDSKSAYLVLPDPDASGEELVTHLIDVLRAIPTV